MKNNIHFFDTLPSTNITAKEMAAEGCEHGTAVIANRQTAGMGRHGRRFFSPPNSGLYMSMVLLAEKIKPFNLSMITPATAVIVCDAIKKIIGLETQIKWVNDILLHGKKICGISAEGVANKGMDSIVVGIGINITTEDFPDDLRTIAASLLPGQKVGEYKNKLLNEILTVFLSTDWNNEKAVCAAYKRRLSMIGSPISVTHGNEKYNATAVDIDDECRLIVKKPNGSLVILSAAEVSVRGIDHE